MMAALTQFHFLRPAWLLLLPMAAVLWWLLGRQGDPLRGWRRLIDPALLPHLVSGHSGSRIILGHMVLALLWLVGILAIAGPTWQREPDPFGENDAALVIVLQAGEQMEAQDLLPSRRERARLESADLARQRPGLPMGLVAYAGTAHLVLPPTRDTSLVATMAGYLENDVMPEPGGNDLIAALKLAQTTLAGTEGGGIIALFTSDVAPGQEAALSQLHQEHGTRIVILPMRGEGADQSGLDAAARALHASVVPLRADDADTQAVVRQAATAQGGADPENARPGQGWRDAGYWLMLPLLALVLLLFRRGTAMPWVIAGCMALLGLPKDLRAQASPPEYWFITPDQKGQRLFDQEKFDDAATEFTDAQWQGAAKYRAGEFKEAERYFARSTTAEAEYNRGTTLIMLGKYEDAVRQFDLALKQRPGWPDAERNRALAQARADLTKKEGGDMGSTLDADEVILDGKKPKENDADQPTEQVEGGPAQDDKSLQEMWLRRVQTKPADFLRAKFAYQRSLQDEPQMEEAP